MSARNLLHQTLGRYQLLVAVARGGMGQVWLGRLQGARGFNKLVAVKTLLPEEGDRPKLEAMLAEEARIASLIHHANVVHTTELGEQDGVLYLVMEWVDGEPLGFLVSRAEERGGMPRSVGVQLISQVLEGLHAAHELSDDSGPLGVVHRDVSPHNILVTYDGVAKLLDFGIAKATHQASHHTQTGEIKGKFSYMAPEQILGSEVDRRVDIFAAGIVLYHLTTGRHPFKHHNTAAVIHAITTDDPVAPPSTLIEDFPADLERVLLKALDKDVTQRWSTAEEMRIALEQAMPEAFGDSGRIELKAFMEKAVGDRRAARREAIRRAQLAADSRENDTGARKALQASSQSASSLRAISISQPAPEDIPELLDAPHGGSSVQAQAPRKRAHKAPYIAAVAGISLALLATVPRLLSPENPTAHTAASGVEAGTRIPAAAKPAPLIAAPVAPPEPVVAPPPRPAVAAPAASAAHETKPKPVSTRAPAKAKSSSATSGSAKTLKGGDDLIAPDYAR
jgi:serine/threonine-protein kinase